MESTNYFSNHLLKFRFPWKLYHAPIVTELSRTLKEYPLSNVLNVGSGPFLEFSKLPDVGARFHLVDIDPRAIEMAKAIHGERLVAASAINPGEPIPYDDASFDLIVSMDVIEHVQEPEAWLRELARVLRPEGMLFLTTPNYGFSTLGIIERTALEAIARYQGFSRKDLHPSKFTKRRLREILKKIDLYDIHVSSVAFGWALVGRARLRSIPMI